VALSVDAVSMTGSAADNETSGPTMVTTFSEHGSRPYVDSMLEINPLDGSCSVRIVVYIQSMRVIFDAVSMLSLSPSHGYNL